MPRISAGTAMRSSTASSSSSKPPNSTIRRSLAMKGTVVTPTMAWYASFGSNGAWPIPDTPPMSADTDETM